MQNTKNIILMNYIIKFFLLKNQSHILNKNHHTLFTKKKKKKNHHTFYFIKKILKNNYN